MQEHTRTLPQLDMQSHAPCPPWCSEQLREYLSTTTTDTNLRGKMAKKWYSTCTSVGWGRE
eukprot:7723517-Prorocentrum_lima.AAC.1